MCCHSLQCSFDSHKCHSNPGVAWSARKGWLGIRICFTVSNVQSLEGSVNEVKLAIDSMMRPQIVQNTYGFPCQYQFSQLLAH